MKKLSLSPADLVVLSLLAEEPMHGYRIVAELDHRDAKDWIEISRPQVYYSLKKLAKLKFVTPTTDTHEVFGPERERFGISKSGKKEMNFALGKTSWAEKRPPPPFLTWMALSSQLSAAITQKIIESRRKFLTKELEREIKTLEEFNNAQDQMAVAGKLMVSLTVELFSTELRWLENVLGELPKARQNNKCPP